MWSRISQIFIVNPKNDAPDNCLAAFIPMELIDANYLSSFKFKTRKWKEIKSGFTHFANGDIAFAKITPCFQNRKSMILKDLPNGIGAGTTELKVLRPLCNFISKEYSLFFLEAPYFIEEATFKGTANQQRIISGYLEEKLFPVPPYKEQERIVSRIKDLFLYANKYGEAQERLDNINRHLNIELRKSILQEAIQGKLVLQDPNDEPASALVEKIRAEKQRMIQIGLLKPKDAITTVIYKGDDNRYYEKIGKSVVCIDEEIPFEIPTTWKWVRFGQLANLRIGKTPARGESAYWSKGIYSWVSISDMADYGIIKDSKEKISQKAKDTIMGQIIPAGTLIMSFKLTVGRTSILEVDAYHNEAIVSVKPYYDYDNRLRDYLFYILPVISNLGDSKDAIKGKTLNSKSLYNLLIPLPSIQEQNRIINMIMRLFDKINA